MLTEILATALSFVSNLSRLETLPPSPTDLYRQQVLNKQAQTMDAWAASCQMLTVVGNTRQPIVTHSSPIYRSRTIETTSPHPSKAVGSSRSDPTQQHFLQHKVADQDLDTLVTEFVTSQQQLNKYLQAVQNKEVHIWSICSRLNQMDRLGMVSAETLTGATEASTSTRRQRGHRGKRG